MLFSKARSYLKFLINSKNHHGVHSPFVFDFVTKSLYQKEKPKNLKAFLNYRKDLLSNSNFIEITDYGAGSKKFKSNSRKISHIAKYAGISMKRGKLLFNLTKYFKPKNILEIGTSLGISSSILSIAAPDAVITTIEGCKATASIAKQQFEKYNFQNIDLKIGDFETTLPKIFKKEKFDLIYFDGNHAKVATLNYFNQSLQSIHNDSVLIFDDIHWSKEMEEAWAEIKNHELVKVTINTFQWGFVFFREEQEKEHFIIRV